MQHGASENVAWDALSRMPPIVDYLAMNMTKIRNMRGLTKRDVELVLGGSYGTGMTFNGLKCLVGYEPPVNASFYPGIGHQWQAVLGDEYVYLEGDGTAGGMRVTSWN